MKSLNYFFPRLVKSFSAVAQDSKYLPVGKYKGLLFHFKSTANLGADEALTDLGNLVCKNNGKTVVNCSFEDLWRLNAKNIYAKTPALASGAKLAAFIYLPFHLFADNPLNELNGLVVENQNQFSVENSSVNVGDIATLGCDVYALESPYIEAYYLPKINSQTVYKGVGTGQIETFPGRQNVAQMLIDTTNVANIRLEVDEREFMDADPTILDAVEQIFQNADKSTTLVSDLVRLDIYDGYSPVTALNSGVKVRFDVETAATNIKVIFTEIAFNDVAKMQLIADMKANYITEKMSGQSSRTTQAVAGFVNTISQGA